MADPVWQVAYQGETTAYYWDYVNQPEYVAGQTISAPSLACDLIVSGPGSTTDISFGAASVSGSKVSAVVSGFKTGTVYRLTCNVTFSGGAGPKKSRGYLECQ